MPRTLRTSRAVADSVVTGLTAMLGAGLFAGIAPATALVGDWLPLAFVIAAVPAFLACCTTSDQAGVFPGAGGGYRYAREQLGRWPARMAGGLYIVGRAAAAGALAGCFGDYLVPGRPQLPALGLLIVVVAADLLDVEIPPRVTRVVTVVVLVVLALVVAAYFAIPSPPPTGVTPPPGTPGLNRPGDLLPAAGVLFFAFLGFERVTAPGHDGDRVAPRIVVPVLMLAALGVYLAVSFGVLRQLGPTRLALSTVPLRDALDAADAATLDPAVTVAVLIATALGLWLVMTGSRRTTGPMSTSGDLPGAKWLVIAGAAICTVTLDPTRAIELAATCALFYYAFAGASARMLARHERVWPARTACFGMAVSVLIGMAMPATDLFVALAAAILSGLSGPLLAMARPARR